jgi:predicted transcriptional regulator
MVIGIYPLVGSGLTVSVPVVLKQRPALNSKRGSFVADAMVVCLECGYEK